jgi:hypothetical protein
MRDSRSMVSPLIDEMTKEGLVLRQRKQYAFSNLWPRERPVPRVNEISSRVLKGSVATPVMGSAERTLFKNSVSAKGGRSSVDPAGVGTSRDCSPLGRDRSHLWQISKISKARTRAAAHIGYIRRLFAPRLEEAGATCTAGNLPFFPSTERLKRGPPAVGCECDSGKEFR